MNAGANASTDPALWRERDSELVSPAYGRYSDLVVNRAEGSHLYTVDGRDILDFGCGIGVTNLGHLHPDVVAAVHKQVDQLWHTSVTTLHTTLIDAAQALTSIAPPGLDQAFFANSGAEAVEGAMKLVRKATGRTEIIAFNGSFHGRTYGALSMTASKAKYRRGTAPWLPGIHHVRYPHCFRLCTHGPGEPCPIAQGEDIYRLFESRISPDTVAAIFVEPIQGEGGYVVPPKEFLPRLREICDNYGILLVIDEVQTGFGRTGKMWAGEHFGVTPDVMTVAKAMGNGIPIAGILASHGTMSAWHPGDHGTTYGGNPIACAAMMSVIEVMQRDHLLERATKLGAHVMERARGWMKDNPELADVRGLGLMIGLEYMEDGRSATGYVTRLQKACVDKGLLLLTCGSEDNVVRVIPPLTVSETDLDAGLDILEQAMSEVRD
jgi:4-aminobutyrate aminotransferase